MINPTIQVLPTPTDVARNAAERIVASARQAIALSGSFSIALSGGSTPKALYQLLASDEFRDQIAWGDVEIFFGDERCVPPEHKDSNFRMAREELLSKVSIPATSIHRMRGEIPAEEAALEYERLLRERFQGDEGLDLILLGMGDDGHTASIFPSTPATRETSRSVLGYFAENSSTGKSWRITLTAPFINRSHEVMFLICGASKAARLTEVLEGPRDPERLPSQLIDPKSGKLLLLLDLPAAGMDQD